MTSFADITQAGLGLILWNTFCLVPIKLFYKDNFNLLWNYQLPLLIKNFKPWRNHGVQHFLWC